MSTLPVTVIGGYLGAGKTTLVNHLLRHADGQRLAVLVNEFGDLPIDPDLIESSDENIINIAGGCVCCSYGSDLMSALMDIETLRPAPDHLLIEASGVALPKAIAQSVQLMQHYSIDGIVVMADVETVQGYATDPYLADTIERQFDDADIVILNKTDLVSNEHLSSTHRWLAVKALGSAIVEAAKADVPNAVILGIHDKIMDQKTANSHNHHHTTAHASKMFPLDNPVNPERLAQALASAALNLIRAKGFAFSTDGKLHALQTVGRRWEVSAAPKTVSGPGRIVCIGHKDAFHPEIVSNAITAAYMS